MPPLQELLQRVLFSIATSRCSNVVFHKKQKRWNLTCLLIMRYLRERTTSDPLLKTFYTSSMQLIRSDEVPPMKRDGILWHSGVGGIRDFGSLIKIHVFFANDTFWNIFKHSTV